MAKSAGFVGVLYLGAVTAVPVSETTKIGIGLSTNFLDSTAQGDSFKEYTPEVQDMTLKVDKFYDDAYGTMINAAMNKTVLWFYAYPNRTVTGKYFMGQCYVSLDSLDSGIGAMNGESWNIVHAGSGAPVGF